MNNEQKKAALKGLMADMRQFQLIAESIAGKVIALEKAGIMLPSVKTVATQLAQIAVLWNDGELEPEITP